MKKFIELGSGKIINTKDIMLISEVKDVIPERVIFDDKGNYSTKQYAYTITYKDKTTVYMLYYDIDDAFADKCELMNELNLG